MASLLPRRVVGVITALLLGAVGVTALASPAQAEEGYEYWMYFHLQDGSWAFAQTGPADHKPADGDVEGFRYGVSTANAGIEPRADLDEVTFDAVCADTEAADGEKRVAVLLDYGTVDPDAPDPRAECAVVAENATTQQVLDEVADVRVENAMTCALNGYPASGCGEQVKNADVPPDEEPVAFTMPTSGDTAEEGTTDAAGDAADDEGAGGLSPLLLVGLVVVLLAAGALLLARRRTTA